MHFWTSVANGYAPVCSKIKDFSYGLNEGLGDGFEWKG